MVQPRLHNNLPLLTRWTRMPAAPSGDWSVFQRIFADHWEVFQHAHPRYQTPYYNGLVGKMLACGNPTKIGYMEYRCLHCGQGKHVVAMSCKSSLCLRCAKVAVDNWVSQVSRVLHEGVIYRHIILTVPAMFRTTFYQNAAVVLSALIRCGAQCLDDFYSTVKGKALKGATSRCSTRMAAMGNIIPICMCLPPVVAMMPRERVGSIASTCPTTCYVANGNGTY